MEKLDPLVERIAEEANLDPDYIEMLNILEADVPYEKINAQSDLKMLKNDLPHMSIITFDSGDRLIVKNETEILVPKCQRSHMVDILHMSHAADQAMVTQCRGKIFWPGMRTALKKKYDGCNTCQEHKASQATPHTDVSGDDIFSNFHPGQRLQVDYCEKGNQDILMIVDYVSGFMQAFKTPRKSTEEAIKCLRSWGSKFGLPYEVKSDNGPAFLKEWKEQLNKMGIKVIHSSAYNSQSMGLVERSVRTIKDILKKNGHLSQLMLDEQVFAINAREDGVTGSANSRFFGRGIRSGLPNSLDRFIDWREDVRKRGELKEKRFLKKERTVGKLTYDVGEHVRLQDIRTKRWDRVGVVTGIRVADDGKILSYDIEVDGSKTTRHRKYLSKIPNSDDETEEENTAGATQATE